jgi:homoserine dehydrogenase
VIGDVIETARNIIRGEAGGVPPLGYPEDWKAAGALVDMKEIVTNYYLRVQAMDRPGVLSKIAGIMAEHSISIHSVIQKGRDRSGTVPVVFLTHLAKEADIQDASQRIEKLDAVEDKPVIMRIEDETLA